MTRLLWEEEADFVIVGTGAGGATAARVLSEAGHSVVMVEEGPHLTTEERAMDLLPTMATTMRDMGSQATLGRNPIPLLQGRLVGGSTAINSGIIWRMPEDVRRDWSTRFGLSTLVEERPQTRIFEQIERELEVEETGASVLGGNSEKMAEACRAMGLPGKPITRNAARCEARNRCLEGCPGEARRSMDVTYVPLAMQQGATLRPLSRAMKVTVRRGRATSVVGDTLDRHGTRTGRFVARARRGVILAAGALHTPVLLRRTGLRGLVGKRLQAHPGCAIVGRFPESITMAYGASQGYEVPMREEGFKLESLSLPPTLLAARLPGAGAEWQDRLAELDHYGQWVVQVRMKAHGTVRPGLFGRPSVRYEPEPADLHTIQRGVSLICRMMFAAGATEVFPGLSGYPEVLTEVAEVETLERSQVPRQAFHLVASHLFGTACAGSDPATSVVGPDLQSHDIEGLFVMDASVFPTNLGVNPQHSIMAVVFRAAEQLANAERAARAA